MPSSKSAIEAAVQRAMLGLLGINKLFSVCKALPPEKFGAALLDSMDVRTEWSGLSPDAIPVTGPLIVVANHPFGLVEALALEAMPLTRRPDVNFIAWHSVGELPRLGQHYIFVDPQLRPETRKRNVRAWRQAFAWIERGGVLGVFPAGRVARFDWSRMAVTDRPWNPHIARIVRRGESPGASGILLRPQQSRVSADWDGDADTASVAGGAGGQQQARPHPARHGGRTDPARRTGALCDRRGGDHIPTQPHRGAGRSELSRVDRAGTVVENRRMSVRAKVDDSDVIAEWKRRYKDFPAISDLAHAAPAEAKA
jgi:hypothetical protein